MEKLERSKLAIENYQNNRALKISKMSEDRRVAD